MSRFSSEPDGLETVADFVRWAASEFNRAGLYFGHGTDNALDESIWLVLHALAVTPPLPDALYSARLTPTERAEVVELIGERLSSRKPAAYLTGQARFAGLDFHVTEDVLVPRSPLAELIEQGFGPFAPPTGFNRVLDLCTGSGCIAIACAMHLGVDEVHATELSAEALAVARRNVARYGLQSVVQLHQGDLFADAPRQGYDLIISNPPYVPDTEMAELPVEYQREPVLGLRAEEEGTAIAARIIASAADYLSPEGILVIEVGNAAEALANRFNELPMEWPLFERGGQGICVIHAADLGAIAADGPGRD
ncbi:50S ribosomal protein L3 N(5)-glutamine methyltransferase [Gammaproteobacteria bacterium AB-CW1]|uniref:50S ribosomal protein L3 N(5)-glutamine methyltransferase n=1 Tax=Natronospira elongata TaxID=3110268 RepID=A0AAP6JCT3_9GAMM|nr:50S ribosomal protein L3 N(5)-glutamine methyltransferase [Gammaproteobacteria bacterium AB-CW1]